MQKQINYVMKTKKVGTAKIEKPTVVKSASRDANGNHKATVINCKNGVNMKVKKS